MEVAVNDASDDKVLMLAGIEVTESRLTAKLEELRQKKQALLDRGLSGTEPKRRQRTAKAASDQAAGEKKPKRQVSAEQKAKMSAAAVARWDRIKARKAAEAGAPAAEPVAETPAAEQLGQ